jgi:hypothetical protein
VALIEDGQTYTPSHHVGEAEDERAVGHRQQALAALAEGADAVALVHAILSVAARIEELTCHTAR